MGAFKNIAIEQRQDPLYHQQEADLNLLECEMDQIKEINDYLLQLKRNDVVDVFTSKDEFRHQGSVVSVRKDLLACDYKGARLYIRTAKNSYEEYWATEINKIEKIPPEQHCFMWFN